MARNGAGSYSLPAGNPVVTGTVISSATHNTTMSDLATAVTQSLAYDGQTVPVANLPMGGFKHTGVGNATARTDYTAAGQVQDGSLVWCGTAGGTANALTLSTTPSITAYVAGQSFKFKSGAAHNTGAATVAISGLAAIAIQVGGSACIGNEILADRWYEVVVDASLTSCQLCAISGVLVNSSDAATARAALGVGLTSRVKGLRGNVNATTPLTKFDLSADEVVLVDTNGATVRRTVTGTITCDLGLAGSAANGRDQSAAFTASSYVNLFLIWNGTALATIASTAAHTTGPTLPTGYTHWTYATTLRWNASSNIVPANIRGSWVENTTFTRVLSGFAATSFTAVSCSGSVPPNALLAKILFSIEADFGTVGTAGLLSYRTTGDSTTTGRNALFLKQLAASVTHDASNTVCIPLNSSQQFDYKLANGPASGGAYADVEGYSVPNGDA